MVELEVIVVVGYEVEGSILAISEPVGGAFNLVDIIWAFIPFLQFGGHVSFHSILPNQDEISNVEGWQEVFTGIMCCFLLILCLLDELVCLCLEIFDLGQFLLGILHRVWGFMRGISWSKWMANLITIK